MTAEILTVGTEILLGDITNTNAQYLSRQLALLGINVYRHSVVGDNPDRLAEALETALSRADLVITTGGLGPTCDDLTKEVVARRMGRELEMNPECLAQIEAYFKKVNRPMTENNKKQALMPAGCTVLPNAVGTAPGCIIEEGGKAVIMLPGPPSEMRSMFEKHVVPFLRKLSDGAIVSRNIRIFGMGEAAVEEKLSEMMKAGKNPTVAPYAKAGEVLIRVTAKAETEEKARAMTQPVVEEIKRIIGPYVYGVDVDSLEQAVVRLLTEKGRMVACAESCTGGYLAKRLTDIPGASKVFSLGMVTYSNEAKAVQLRVRPETLAQYGAVSKYTAMEMAHRIRQISGAYYGVAITGIAGPDGGPAKSLSAPFMLLSATQRGWSAESSRPFAPTPTGRRFVLCRRRTRSIFLGCLLSMNSIKKE